MAVQKIYTSPVGTYITVLTEYFPEKESERIEKIYFEPIADYFSSKIFGRFRQYLTDFIEFTFLKPVLLDFGT
jgi:hypothetical protein